ncbi:HD-GYP domain-containing protein [Tumebacillus sp. ITR2]|uniref:HD-GYP domain-containing protein n=1 Tax=Tumebacillus amylolyticus TaxID=2801339 RepID=A0ABS1JA73_9BACL|nr:HD-GYP domain-containing protein [Tumebacillus amylolyticus]MBL0387187.1 HD-GYP domain-containing protein [Tumebacillus amylolyticus]
MMYLSFFTFAILSVFAHQQYFVIPVGNQSRFREDGHVLLFAASMWVGGSVMLAFTAACYIAVYSFQRLRYKWPYKPLNLLLVFSQAITVQLVLSSFERWLPAQKPLALFVMMFATVLTTQLVTLFVSSLLFQISLRTGGWKRALLKFTLMDSIYLTLYVIATAYADVVEDTPWLRICAQTVIVVSIIGLYYWRTVGIKQDRTVEMQVRKLQDLNARMTVANQQVLLAFASSLEKRDPYTAGHSERVAQYAVEIAGELGLTDDDLKVIHLGGLLHDIGKIGIPDHVLNKPDRLTAEEYDIMKQHPVIGEELLRRVYTTSELLDEDRRERMLEIVLSHHERPDGKGYPQGLVDEQIPLYAKITAVADAYDAMTSNRAYRNAMSQEQATRILLSGRETQFWAPAVDAFVRVLERRQFTAESDVMREVSSALDQPAS